MTLLRYDVRAEHADKTFEDFHVTAEDNLAARILAEEKICSEKRLPFFGTVFDWRGMVVFVNHSPRV